MLDEKKLEEGKDFQVPCNEILRRGFSSLKWMHLTAALFTGEFNTKRTLVARSYRENHNHGHYVAKQKVLYRWKLSAFCWLLELAEEDVACAFNLL
eukprot:8164765-Ditylum_brightwellii.AAC.1